MNRFILLAVAACVSMSAQPALIGTWVGSGTLTNDWADASDPKIALRCVYTGKAQPPSITLRIPAAGGQGQLVLAIPSSSASCPALRKQFQIEARIDGQRMTFVDPAGSRWTLSLTKDLLSGDVRWSATNNTPDEALEVGFAYQRPLQPWHVPLTRLSGTVTLSRARVPPSVK